MRRYGYTSVYKLFVCIVSDNAVAVIICNRIQPVLYDVQRPNKHELSFDRVNNQNYRFNRWLAQGLSHLDEEVVIWFS